MLSTRETGVTQREATTVRNILINTWGVAIVAVGTLGVSLVTSLATGNPDWVSRAGSIMTLSGLLLLVKHSVLCAGTDLESAMLEKLHYRRSEAPPRPGTAAYHADLRHTRRILVDEFFGFALSVIGTVIWGYGDLLFAPMVP